MRHFIFIAIALCLCSFTSEKTIDLSGKWSFALDPNDLGITEQWYVKPLSGTIQLPGSLQEQGYGENVGVETKWTGGVQDTYNWYKGDDYASYRQAGNIKFPYWLQPDKYYVGVAWYQREVDVPASWKGKYMELELERTHWETTLYVNGKEAGKSNALLTPHRYAISETGKLLLTVRVDNRVNIPVGRDAHSVTDHTQSNWNGIVGNISLSAKPALHIADVRVYPDVKAKKARVEVYTTGNSAGKAKITLKTKSFNSAKPIALKSVFANMDGGVQSPVVLEVAMGNDMQTWSEFEPNLYRMEVELSSKSGTDVQTVEFGMREFKAEGTRFTVNGTPVFLRGTLECAIFPLTGYPSVDPAYWTKIYRRCKEFGLNHVRFHSWCPPQVAFEVADREGIYLQVECGGWTRVGDGDASDHLQTLCYKADIEAALRTPAFAGFQLLDLHDFPGQGTALVGVLDPFWDTKGYVEGKEYSSFCNSVVPLARMDKLVWTNDETFKAALEVSHFAKKPLKGATVEWEISDASKKTLASGKTTKDLPVDNCIAISNIELPLLSVKEPSQLTLSVKVAEAGTGKMMVCSADIATDLDNRPAARQFRRSIEQYMVSDKFKPTVEIDTKTISGLLK